MRVFFGVQPDPDLALRIASWRDRQLATAGRPVPVSNFHITLAFLGEISPASMDGLCQRVDDYCGRSSPGGDTVDLDQTGYWPRPGIYWLGPSRWPDSLLQLAMKLRGVSSGCGAKQERKRFQPHITLFRGCTDAPPAPAEPPSFSMPYRDFALFESRQGRRGVSYHPLQYWDLRGGKAE